MYTITRKQRKLDHIEHFLTMPEISGLSCFGDLTLIHNALPELNWDMLNTEYTFLGHKLRAPLIINAITGGHPNVLNINSNLAEAAAITGIGMAVGSQQAALEDPTVLKTFSIAREKNPNGLLLANLSALCTLEEALQAIQMIDADGIQLYLNVSQELVMPEGELNFKGALSNIEYLSQNLPIPLIVKEVGCGINKETAGILFNAGVRYLDLGGFGGVNFASIEGKRRGESDTPLSKWGIPTAISLLETLTVNKRLLIIATGGLRTPEEAVKSLVAGAAMIALAGPFLQVLQHQGLEGLIKYINSFITGIAQIMMLTGAQNITQLTEKPLVITGYVAEWMHRRGIDIDCYARRS